MRLTDGHQSRPANECHRACTLESVIPAPRKLTDGVVDVSLPLPSNVTTTIRGNLQSRLHNQSRAADALLEELPMSMLLAFGPNHGSAATRCRSTRSGSKDLVSTPRHEADDLHVIDTKLDLHLLDLICTTLDLAPFIRNFCPSASSRRVSDRPGLTEARLSRGEEGVSSQERRSCGEAVN